MSEVKTKKPKETLYGNNIKLILKHIGMTQQELADTVGTSKVHISKIVNGERRSISLPIAMKIANVLQRPVEEVFILNEPKESK